MSRVGNRDQDARRDDSADVAGVGVEPSNILGQDAMLGPLQRGIFFRERSGFTLGQLGQIGIILPYQMQIAVAALAPAQQLADAAQAQINLRQMKAIVRCFHGGQALFSNAQFIAINPAPMQVMDAIKVDFRRPIGYQEAI